MLDQDYHPNGGKPYYEEFYQKAETQWGGFCPDSSHFEDGIEKIASRILNPPINGYEDGGYKVIHLYAQHHPVLNNECPKCCEAKIEPRGLTRDFKCVSCGTDYTPQSDDVDSELCPVNPFVCDSMYAPSWEEIAVAVERMMDPRHMAGMTQAFLVIPVKASDKNP